MDDAFEVDVNAAGLPFAAAVELFLNIRSRRVSAYLNNRLSKPGFARKVGRTRQMF